METTPRDPRLARWLDAEAGQDELQAETALCDLFATMPRGSLGPAFADRVLARIAAEPAPWPLERAAACLLLLCGVALAGTRLWLPLAWARFEPEAWIAAAVSLVVRLGQGIATLAPVWEATTKVVGWVALAGSSPQVLGLLAACALLATTASRLLFAVLDERSSGHARA
jgi:hypothetical protein